MGKPKQLRSNPKLPDRKIKPPNHLSKFCQWSDASMKEAMKAVHNGKMPINHAALEHGVPPTTLKDRLSGRVKHGTKPGPRPYLSPEEEEELALFVVNCSKMGYGKTRRKVLQFPLQVTSKA